VRNPQNSIVSADKNNNPLLASKPIQHNHQTDQKKTPKTRHLLLFQSKVVHSQNLHNKNVQERIPKGSTAAKTHTTKNKDHPKEPP